MNEHGLARALKSAAAAGLAVAGAAILVMTGGPLAQAAQQPTGVARRAGISRPVSAPTPTSAPAQDTPTEEIVISGAHEGPRLWKIRKGDHVLWILGTVTPLPKKMIWQSAAVEDILQQTQEVVPSWPAFGIGANPFTALRVYIQWRRMQKIPDRMNLQEVLPPPLYARFSA